MTMNHFDPSELDRVAPELEELAERLEAYAAEVSPLPPIALTTRILEAVDAEPVPLAWRARLAAWLMPLRGLGRGLAGAAVVAAAIVVAVAFAALSDASRDRVGTSPPPSIRIVVPSPSGASSSPTASPSPSATPSVSPSATPTVAPTVSPTQRLPAPTPTGDDDDEIETPEPSDDDHSGPGGGSDDDSSGPGGGDD